jgi:RNA polymerase primary sigma factor
MNTLTLPDTPANLVKLTPVSEKIWNSIFERKQASTIELLTLLPKEKKGAQLKQTLSDLINFFHAHNIAIVYSIKEEIITRIEPLLTKRIKAPDLIHISTVTHDTSTELVKPEKSYRKQNKEESVDFNEFEKYSETYFSSENESSTKDVEENVDWYLKSITKHSIFDKETVYKLVTQAQQGSVKARNILVMHNQRLIVKVASHYRNNLVENETLEFPDLVQEAQFGLIKAIEKFDMSLGLNLSTYAHWWISQSITRALADYKLKVRIPVHMKEKLARFKKIYCLLEIRSGTPNMVEVAEELGITTEEAYDLQKLNHQTKELSLDGLMDEREDESDMTIADCLGEKGVLLPHTLVDRKILKERLRKSLKVNLTMKEYEIVDLRFGLSNNKPMTLEEVGVVFNVTRERIRQIEATAFKKIKTDTTFLEYVSEYFDKQFTGLEQSIIEQKIQQKKVNLEKEQAPNQKQLFATHWRTLKKTQDTDLFSTTLNIVSKYYGIPHQDLIGESRKTEIVAARHIAMYILHGHHRLSFPVIAKKFDGMNHSSIIHAFQKIQSQLLEKESLRLEVEFLIGLFTEKE